MAAWGGGIRRIAAAAALTLGTAALGNAYETYGFGSRATAMGGAATANGNDYTAVWYNPALLATRSDVDVGIDVVYQGMHGTVTPLSAAATVDCTYCSAPAPTFGYSGGLVIPLGGKVKDRVAVGLAAYLPGTQLLRTLAPDPNRPFWYRYTGSPERIVITGGLGIRLLSNLEVGIGAQALADLVGTGASVEIDLFSKQVRFREIDQHLSSRTSPIAGVAWQALPNLRFGFNYRYAMQLSYSVPVNVNLDGIGSLSFPTGGTVHYSPHSFSLGAAYDPTPKLTLALDGSFDLWSLAPSPYMNLSIALSGPTLQALGLTNALNMTSPSTPPGFQNSFAARAGLEYRQSDRLAFRGGVFLRGTPVPRQDAAGTNILDSDTVGLSGGLGFAFNDPLEVFQAPIRIDLALQGAYLLPRTANKDITDVVPSYNYSGFTLGGSASLRYDF